MTRAALVETHPAYVLPGDAHRSLRSDVPDGTVKVTRPVAAFHAAATSRAAAAAARNIHQPDAVRNRCCPGGPP